VTRRLVESLSGVGVIHTGDTLLRKTPYKLSVWTEGPGGRESNSDATVDGHIDITGIAEALVLAGPDTLVLTLEDGRRLVIQLTSSGGSIVGRGWLP
jgi:hypothetical protein